jgi:hypothetical protein
MEIVYSGASSACDLFLQKVVAQHAEQAKAIESIRYFISAGMSCILNFSSEGHGAESRGAGRRDGRIGERESIAVEAVMRIRSHSMTGLVPASRRMAA